jgi:hypothetical protein
MFVVGMLKQETQRLLEGVPALYDHILISEAAKSDINCQLNCLKLT